jgi:hypothetical protein
VQLRVFCFGLLQEGDVRVGVFPERGEVLVGALGFALVSRQNVGPAQFQVRQCADGLTPDDAGVIENLLKLSGSCGALLRWTAFRKFSVSALRSAPDGSQARSVRQSLNGRDFLTTGEIMRQSLRNED